MTDVDHMDAISLLLRRLFRPSESTVPVVHPSFKALGRIWVPWPVITHTAGLDRAMQGHAHAPSLCALYQTGKCNSKDRCNQIHVNREWASTVWHALELASQSNCCFACGDFPSLCHDFFRDYAGAEVDLKVPGGPAVSLPIEKIAATRFWHQLLAKGCEELEFPPSRVCMLHQQDSCKYGVECKNVHLCRHVWQEMVESLGIAADIVPQGQPEHMEYVPVEIAAACKTERCKRSQPLSIIDPTSGREVGVPHCKDAPQCDAASPAAPPSPSQPAPSKRTSHALAIVDPKSGEELNITPARPPNAEVALLSPALTPQTSETFIDINLLSQVGSSGPEEKALEEPGDTPKDGKVRRVPTIEAMSEYDTVEGPAAKAQQWGHCLEATSGMSDISRETASGGTPGSPASSIGSDCASSASSAFVAAGRNFPKPATKLKMKTREPSSFFGSRPRADGKDAQAWASKTEASRGVLKRLNAGLLGVVLTEGPKPKGFGLGRGRPVACHH